MRRPRRSFGAEFKLEGDTTYLKVCTGTVIWKRTKLFLADFLGDVQGRQAVLTNQCWVPVINYMHGVKKEDYNRFYEDMLPNESLYDVVKKDTQGNYISGRMAFISRIAKDYHKAMDKYSFAIEAYLEQLAKENIVRGV